MASNKRKNKRKRRKKTLADTADPFLLYQLSVQRPEVDIEFFIERYVEAHGKKPMSLREDFCGTAYLATEWVKTHKKRTSIGVDLDGPTLDWGRKNILGPEKKSVRDRIKLVQANVLEVKKPPVDIICALNFSYCVFKTREVLTEYFRVAHKSLAKNGMFFCELYGGTEAIDELEERRDVEGPEYDFIYVWDQDSFNPITNETLCHIHFQMPDKSKIKKAYTYDWRLWTCPEVVECLREAGFSRVGVYWEGCDDDGEGEGTFRLTEKEENQEGWLVYFVAHK